VTDQAENISSAPVPSTCRIRTRRPWPQL
jgi:hypothetical protein